MKNIYVIFMTFLFLANLNHLEANWLLHVAYSQDNRGYQWDEISTAPLKGFEIEFGRQIYTVNNRFQISGGLEYLLQRRSYIEYNPNNVPLYEAADKVQRVGLFSQLQIDMGMMEPFLGVGTGIELYNRIFELKEGSDRVLWLEGLANRHESSPYIHGFLGIQLGIFPVFKPYISLEAHRSFYSNENYVTNRNKIRSTFIGGRIGITWTY